MYWSYQLAKLPHSLVASVQSHSLKDDIELQGEPSSKQDGSVITSLPSSVGGKSEVRPNSKGRNIDLPHHEKSAK